MTEKEWREELDAVLGGGLLPWRVASAWCNTASGICSSALDHRSTGKTRVVRVSPQEFMTEAARKEEIVRQLDVKKVGS